jgi:uncharacterized protein (UPF0548 family)
MGFLRAADLGRLTSADPTYPEVGATRTGPLPAGYDHLERTAVIGRGGDTFERAAAAVLAWGAQRGVGLSVRSTGPANHEGTVAVLTVGLSRLGYDIPCRVVWARSLGDERGFGYGTLPGHPEIGEEAFVVRLRPDGDVTFTVRAFSRPRTLLLRLGGPVTRLAQRTAADLYTAAIRRAARTPA